jgi:predicted RNase H-like nuclease (RuvC/YqgF family)
MTVRNSNGMTIMIGGVLLALQIGCVANSTYEESQQRAYSQHQQDQRQILDFNIEVRRLKERVEELESSIQSEREHATRIELERNEIRDELLKLKIAQEQQVVRRPDRGGGARSSSDLQEENARLRDRLEDAKRRLKDLFQQMQRLLEPS